jgi:hypothetical protein
MHKCCDQIRRPSNRNSDELKGETKNGCTFRALFACYAVTYSLTLVNKKTGSAALVRS